MRLLVTRPEPDALKLGGVLEEMGHEATVDPLLSVSFEGGEPVDLDSAQALIATSRNALRAIKASPALIIARALPLFAVGKATAAEARALGFETVVTGAGTAAELVAHIVSALDPAAGLCSSLGRRYSGGEPAGRVGDTRLPRDSAHRLSNAPGTRLGRRHSGAIGNGRNRRHNPDVAAHGCGLRHPSWQARLAATIRPLPHFCLSAAVARRLQPLGTVRIEIAEAPRLEELLALIDETAAQLEG